MVKITKYQSLLKAFQSKDVLVFIAFVLAILIKNILFQRFVFGDLYLKNPINAFKFYGAVISIAALLVSPIFVTKRYWWTVVLLMIVDVWYMALMVYYRSWGAFMNVSVIRMADNMDGFWASVWTYLNWKSVLPLCITIIFTLFISFWGTSEKKKCRWGAFIGVLILAYCYIPLRQYPAWKNGLEDIRMNNPYTNKLMYSIHNYYYLFRPYNSIRQKAYVSYIAGGVAQYEEKFIKEQGFCDYAFAMLVFQITYDLYARRDADVPCNVSFSNDETAILQILEEGNKQATYVPQRSMIVLLVESFESWVIDYEGIDGFAMPNLRQFMKEQTTFYADKLISQAKYGGSGDGQMIVMTGMIPLQSGAACRLYGDNVYPNIAQFYPASVTLNSSPGAWNQSVVNPNYGIKELDENIEQDDHNIITNLISRIDKDTMPTFYLVITVSSHTPFKKAKEIKWEVDESMPNNMANYIKCLHYFDEQFGALLSYLQKKERLRDFDIVITGDHIIFQKMMLSELVNYANTHSICLYNDKNYCPLIISSSLIEKNCRYTNVAYQMDTYPTIMNAVGADSYWWKGFGINLLSDTVRKFDLETLETLSDKLIRSNYFAK